MIVYERAGLYTQWAILNNAGQVAAYGDVPKDERPSDELLAEWDLDIPGGAPHVAAHREIAVSEWTRFQG